MKVTIPESSHSEYAAVLKAAGLTEPEIQAFLAKCTDPSCSQMLRTLRDTRKAVLESIHEKQTVLDRLDYMIWCTEHKKKEQE